MDVVKLSVANGKETFLERIILKGRATGKEAAEGSTVDLAYKVAQQRISPQSQQHLRLYLCCVGMAVQLMVSTIFDGYRINGPNRI